MTNSPDGTTITAPTAATLTTVDGVWTFTTAFPPWGYNIDLNGSGPVGTAALMEVANGGQLYAQQGTGSWYVYSGGSFVASGPPPVPNPGAPTITSTSGSPVVTVNVSLPANAVAGDLLRLFDGSTQTGSDYALTSTDITNGTASNTTGTLS